MQASTQLCDMDDNSSFQHLDVEPSLHLFYEISNYVVVVTPEEADGRRKY
jgi:hypothetical protein